MPILIFVGWLVGLLIAALVGVAALIGLGLSLPGFLTPLGTIIAAIIAPFSPILILAFSLIFLIVAYLAGYMIATSAIAPLLPPLVTGPIAFPLTSQATPASGAATTIPATNGEFFARGMLVGLTAALNFVLLGLIPLVGVLVGLWAFIVISLGAILFVARNRVYQGFLGWSAWLFPVSYVATSVGLLLFIVNIPFAFTAFGPGAFRIDWTTGVIESAGGLSGITGFSGGFSLGNFNFVTALPAAGTFTTSSLSSHETGHTLNTAAFGGIVLWINAVDENIWPGRFNLAYGELTAEGHSRNMPGTPRVDFSVGLWV